MFDWLVSFILAALVVAVIVAFVYNTLPVLLFILR
jgi:hypothetical protein